MDFRYEDGEPHLKDFFEGEGWEHLKPHLKCIPAFNLYDKEQHIYSAIGNYREVHDFIKDVWTGLPIVGIGDHAKAA